jgi:hypothetical protein
MQAVEVLRVTDKKPSEDSAFSLYMQPRNGVEISAYTHGTINNVTNESLWNATSIVATPERIIYQSVHKTCGGT